jgi:hypothetical protein
MCVNAFSLTPGREARLQRASGADVRLLPSGYFSSSSYLLDKASWKYISLSKKKKKKQSGRRIEAARCVFLSHHDHRRGGDPAYTGR